MDAHQDIAKGYVKGDRVAAEALWAELTAKLNSSGPPTKDLNGWKKTWADWKVFVKRKLCHNKKEDRKTLQTLIIVLSLVIILTLLFILKHMVFTFFFAFFILCVAISKKRDIFNLGINKIDRFLKKVKPYRSIWKMRIRNHTAKFCDRPVYQKK